MRFLHMDQHYLPKCYLNEFTNSDGTFYALNNELFKREKSVYIQHKTPAKVCYAPDYYTLDMKVPPTYAHLNQEDTLVLERELFWRYENEYPQILKMIKNQRSLTYSQAELLIKALISIKLRNKFIRDEYMGEQHQNMIRQIFSDHLISTVYDTKKHYPQYTEEQIVDAINSVKIRATSDPEFIKMLHLTGLIDRERNPQSVINAAAKKFLNCTWLIVESDFSATFITTDNPGYCVDRTDSVHNVKLADCTLVFPLTPLLCLMISDKVPDQEIQSNILNKRLVYRQVDSAMINGINSSSLYYFSRYIFAQTSQTLNSISSMVTLANKKKSAA